MTIMLDTSATQADEVVRGRGWTRVTPVQGDRYYTFGLDPHRYHSITATLARAWPGDYSGPTIAWTVADAMSDEFTMRPEDERRQWLKGAKDRHLTAAGNRGNAVHRAAEALSLGRAIDLYDLEANGALPWLASVEAWARDWLPDFEVIATEAVIRVDDAHAGTVDLIARHWLTGEVWVVDFKSRSQSHNRQTKEAAQLGAYTHGCQTGTIFGADVSNLTVDHCAIITFNPTATYAVHHVAPLVAYSAWYLAVEMANRAQLDVLYGPTAKGTFDHRADITERLATVADGTPERATLAARWTTVGLPAVAELTPEQYGTARRLLAEAEPFEQHPAEPLAPDTAVHALLARISDLPGDIAKQVGPVATILTVDELDICFGLVELAEAAHADRANEIRETLEVGQYPALRTILGDPRRWTAVDLDHAYLIRDSIASGVLDTRGQPLAESLTRFAALPKKPTLDAGKALAKQFGRPAPRACADIATDVVLFAAVLAA